MNKLRIGVDDKGISYFLFVVVTVYKKTIRTYFKPIHVSMRTNFLRICTYSSYFTYSQF